MSRCHLVVDGRIKVLPRVARLETGPIDDVLEHLHHAGVRVDRSNVSTKGDDSDALECSDTYEKGGNMAASREKRDWYIW